MTDIGVRPIKAVLVSNAPAPYRVPLWQRTAAAPGIDFEVIYCTQPHIDTSLDADAHGFPVHFLGGSYEAKERRFFHSNRDIISLLERIKPDVVVTTGFIPTYLYAFLWAYWRGAAHVAFTDGTLTSEAGLSALHRWIRRRVFKRTKAFVGACEGSRALFQSYGIDDQTIHLANLCIENQRFAVDAPTEKRDLIFCGRFIDTKQPLFALEIARGVAERLGRRVSIDFVGQGPLESEMRAKAASMVDAVDVRFLGYATQAELPERYTTARIFLFPSEFDVWGIVANEACAAGLPVVVSPHAGAAGELIVDGVNGFVRPLQHDAWADAVTQLLSDQDLYLRMSDASRTLVSAFNFDSATSGLVGALRQAAMSRTARQLERSKRVVCIIQAVAKRYRLEFFEALHQALATQGTELKVIYSSPNPVEALRHDAIDLPSTFGVKVPAYWFAGHHVLHQAALKQALSADLVIVEQASKHVTNYLLHALRSFGRVRMAYWGHGRNWQRDGVDWMEPVKHALIRHVDWWFAYTRRVKDYVSGSGFPPERVTVVQNSVDVEAFTHALADLDPIRSDALRNRLGLTQDSQVGLFCGSLHTAKHPAFLIDAALRIRQRRPSFHLLVLGAGPEEDTVRRAASEHNWIHYVGPVFGEARAPYFSVAQIFLCPGLVGLAVLDAFAARLPIFTTNIPVHSPEVDYIEAEINGCVTRFDVDDYAEVVIRCLADPVRLQSLRDGAGLSATRYGLKAMVENFTSGISACLNHC